MNRFLLTKIFILLFAILPIIYLIYILVKFSVDLPTWVEWYSVPLFEKMFSGSLTFYDLWSQHNEHRLVFPHLLTLALGQLTGWNLKYEIAFNLILGFGIFLSLVYFLNREVKHFRKYSILFILPTLSFLVFSLSQFENWTWGMQKLVFMNLFSILVGLLILTSPIISWVAVGAAVVFGTFATYSYAGGLSYWPIGFVIIFLHPKISKIRKVRFLTIWVVISLLIYISYFFKYQKPAFNPPIPMTLVFEHPIDYVKLVLMLLGSPLEIFSPNRAIASGIFGLVIYAYLLLKFIRGKLFNNTLILSSVALGFYAIFNSVVTGAGRLGLGLPTQPVSRYITVVELFWVVIVVMIYFNLNISQKSKSENFLSFNWLKIFTIFTIVLISAFSINSSAQGTKITIERYGFLSDVRGQLFSNDPSLDKLALWGSIYPRVSVGDLRGVTNITQLHKDLDTLSKYKLSIFRE